MVRRPQASEVWRFQIGTLGPKVVTGMTHDRSRFAFWALDDSWRQRFGTDLTIYRRVAVGPGWDAPSVVHLGEATMEDWRNG